MGGNVFSLIKPEKLNLFHTKIENREYVVSPKWQFCHPVFSGLRHKAVTLSTTKHCIHPQTRFGFLRTDHNGLPPVRHQAKHLPPLCAMISIGFYMISFRLLMLTAISFDIGWPGDTIKKNQPTRLTLHDDVIKWKHLPRYWPCVWGINRWPVNSPHNGQWRGALIFSLICTWINAHYDVIVMGSYSL